MKSLYARVLLTILIGLTIGITPVAASSTRTAAVNGVSLNIPDTNRIEGYIRVVGSTTKEKIKLLVIGAGKEIWYDVKLDNQEFDQEIWFDRQGKYTIRVMINEYAREYRNGPSITVENVEMLDKYLIPAKHIESNEEVIISTAREITKNCSTDLEKVRAIYDWVVENIEYDYEKLSKHKEGQYDNQYGALNTLNTRKGVCYDYSTLVAALVRSLDIKAKVVEGNLDSDALKGFHAWNEIYISDLGYWVNIDATLGSTTGGDYFHFENNGESYLAYEYR